MLLHALLCVRGLVMQKTSLTHECATKLQPLLTSLHEGSEPDRRRFLAACVASMREHAAVRHTRSRMLAQPHARAGQPTAPTQLNSSPVLDLT